LTRRKKHVFQSLKVSGEAVDQDNEVDPEAAASPLPF